MSSGKARNILLVNPDSLPAELPDLLARFAPEIEIESSNFAPMGTPANLHAVVERGRFLVAAHPDATGFLFESGYDHHISTGVSVARFERYRQEHEGAHFVFGSSDAHSDDCSISETGHAMPAGLVSYASFVPQVAGLLKPEKVVLAELQSAEMGLRNHDPAYLRLLEEFFPSDIMYGNGPQLPEDAAVIWTVDTDLLDPSECLTSFPAMLRQAPTSRQNISWLDGYLNPAKRAEEGTLPCFTIFGYDRIPCYEPFSGELPNSSVLSRARQRSAYTYAAHTAALCGLPESAEKILDEADRLYPLPSDVSRKEMERTK
jgi:hypothetical protein